VVKYRKIPPAAAANQIAENARIPPAADLQKKKKGYWGEHERAPQFGGSSSSSAMHYGAFVRSFVVRTYTELFLQ
jgi:hypothetical protein